MKLTDFIAAMDNLAPRELALGFDNVGLLIGTERRDIKRCSLRSTAQPMSPTKR